MYLNSKFWLVIEPTFIGHHYTYLENIIEQAIINKVDIIIATQNNNDGYLIKKKLLEKFTKPPRIILIGEMHEIKNGINIFSLFLHEIKVRNYYKKIFKLVSREFKISHVFIPYLDDFIYSLSLFGSPFKKTSFSGISMRQQFHLTSKDTSNSKRLILFFKKFLFIYLIKNKNLTNLLIIDPKLKEYIDTNYYRFSNKVKYFGDPVNNLKLTKKSKAREILSIPEDNVVILLFGYIDERKGVYNLINWAIKNNNTIHLTILIIGTQSEEIRNFFKLNKVSDKLNLIFKDEFVSECDEGLFFSATDFVWIAYTEFYLMSSVLVKSAQAELSIIYYDFGLISYFAKKYGSQPALDSIIFKKRISFDDNLCIATFTKSNNQFIRDHTWENAGYLFFNS